MKIHLQSITKKISGPEKKTKRQTSFVLGPLTLTIPEKQMTVLVGPSGCGKTTLLRLIAGLDVPDDGTITIGSMTVFDRKKNLWVKPNQRSVAIVFQDFALWPHLRVEENIAFGLKGRLKPQEIENRTRDVLKLVGLEHRRGRYPHQLSGGEQQRVALARALSIRPDIILFDEPLSALDAHLRESLRLTIKEIVETMGLTALYVTHDQEEALSIADQLVIMQSGKIEQMGRPEEVYRKPSTTFAARFIGTSNWLTETSFIRPEHVFIETENSEQPIMIHSIARSTMHSIAATVLNCDYLGDRYRLYVRTEFEETWVVYARHNIPSQTHLTLTFSQEHVQHVLPSNHSSMRSV
ncbi:MAG: ABC transporter ATP-binding protein [Candidatus Carbobacillus altaicus]|nr:ABC transporter ATP-binding protein [Candidatus Carbobacillus altaicus]